MPFLESAEQFTATQFLGQLSPIVLSLLGGTLGFLATATGAFPACVIKRISLRAEDVMLGFAAGMMLAASAFSLISPGVEAAAELTSSRIFGPLLVIAGIGLGVAFMLLLHRITPHEHLHIGVSGKTTVRLARIWLFVFAITLHNLPEGMAIGVGFAKGDVSVGLPLALAIAIQDVPEGLAVAVALRSVYGARLAVVSAAFTGIMEPIGAIVGFGIAASLALLYPVAMGFAAGAMVFVVSHEVIPESHRSGHQTLATVGLMVGFAVMVFLDTAL